MKRYYILLTLTFLLASAANAQQLTGGISIDGLKVEENDGKVNVSFTAGVARRSIASNYTFVFAPVLTDGTYSVSMPPVIVQGKRAQRSLRRYEWVSGDRFGYDGAIYAPMGAETAYAAEVESQAWMQGADLVIESVLGGCCSYRPQPGQTFAENISIRQEPLIAEVVPVPVIEPALPAIPAVPAAPAAPVFTPVTLADTLSVSFPFVANASEFDRENPLMIYDDERENALIVYYGIRSSAIDRRYRDNEQVLSNITEVVKMIMNDPKSEVEAIVVGGFSSPDGNYEINDRLAFERAVSVKEYIVKTTGMKDDVILVYNGSVDWRGLRYMIAKSNMPDRDEIIRIIDDVPVWDAKAQRGRLGELMRLNGGAPYRRLLAEYFPLLRNGAFIKIYYKNK